MHLCAINSHQEGTTPGHFRHPGQKNVSVKKARCRCWEQSGNHPWMKRLACLAPAISGTGHFWQSCNSHATWSHVSYAVALCVFTAPRVCAAGKAPLLAPRVAPISCCASGEAPAQRSSSAEVSVDEAEARALDGIGVVANTSRTKARKTDIETVNMIVPLDVCTLRSWTGAVAQESRRTRPQPAGCAQRVDHVPQCRVSRASGGHRDAAAHACAPAPSSTMPAAPRVAGSVSHPAHAAASKQCEASIGSTALRRLSAY